jgi:tetratricopeptide (TPR) repeat protein
MDHDDVRRARLQRLEAYRAQDPHNPALLSETCAAAIAAGEWARAAELADGGEVLDAQAREALQCLLLRALHRARRLEEAATWADAQQRAGTLQPGAAAVASMVAIDRDDFTAARTLADAAMRHASPPPEALVARACVAIAEQDPALATDLLQRALEQLPDDGRTWSALALASLQAGDATRARPQFERALGSMPQHIGSWHGLGWSCLALRDVDAALQAFEQAIALDRNFAESHAGLALALLLAGRGAEAETPLAQAERLDRGNLTGRFARAWQRGEVTDRRALQALASRLLDRPGFFGGRLADGLAQWRTKATPP